MCLQAVVPRSGSSTRLHLGKPWMHAHSVLAKGQTTFLSQGTKLTTAQPASQQTSHRLQKTDQACAVSNKLTNFELVKSMQQRCFQSTPSLQVSCSPPLQPLFLRNWSNFKLNRYYGTQNRWMGTAMVAVGHWGHIGAICSTYWAQKLCLRPG
jgi:hypothetical protein